MHLLVTRPEPDAMRTASRLALLGHEVLVEPMLVIDFQAPPALAAPSALVVTSRNGIRALQRWPDAVDWRDLPLFAIGSATAEAAEEAGFTDLHVAGHRSADLVELVAKSFSPADGTLLYPAAVDRSGDLEVELATRGYSLRLIEAYRAHAVDRLSDRLADRLRRQQLDGLLFFSQRTAATFGALVATAGLVPSLAHADIYALSETVAAPVRGLSPKSVHVAERPTEDALLDLIPPPAG